jgi:hypothetical protein
MKKIRQKCKLGLKLGSGIGVHGGEGKNVFIKDNILGHVDTTY